MKLLVRPSTLRGTVAIPGSKSHTIRALAIASLADGESRLEAPLASADTLSCAEAFRALGAEIEQGADVWRVRGHGPNFSAPSNAIDVGNSGTTMNVALGACSLLRDGAAILTGDAQIRRRPSGALATALNDLGAKVESTRGNGCPPWVVRGRLRGGQASLEALSSQYVTSLLLACPLANEDTRLFVPTLHEQPYVEMTLDWLRSQDIGVEHTDFREFRIRGAQKYRPFTRRIPADFSSATFFLCAGAMGGNDVVSTGLDMNDSQGDKAVVDYLRRMGARVDANGAGIRVSAAGPGLAGAEIDLNDTPDALPMMAALACFARGETRLVNVAHARIKETDRIATMARELAKMGAKVEERPDGLVIRQSDLRGAAIEGHDDHRIVMALAVAACSAKGETVISGAEAVGVTYPGFVDSMRALGADIEAIPN